MLTSTSPAIGGFPVTPSDDRFLRQQCRGFYVGTSGDVDVLTADGSHLVFKNVAAGAVYPVACAKILAAATTATDIVALY